MARIDPLLPRTLAAILCANWDIVDVTYSLPLQLRRHGGEPIKPIFFVLLFELSKITKGGIGLVQTRLRREVLRRLQRSKQVEKPEVTTADVNNVMAWFRRRTPTEKKQRYGAVVGKEKGRDNTSDRKGEVVVVRRSARLAADKVVEGSLIDSATTETDGQSTEYSGSGNESDEQEIIIPNSPPTSPYRHLRHRKVNRDSKHVTSRNNSGYVSNKEGASAITNRIQNLDGYLSENLLQNALPSFARDTKDPGTVNAQTRRRLARLIQLREGRHRQIVDQASCEQSTTPSATETRRLEDPLGIVPESPSEHDRGQD